MPKKHVTKRELKSQEWELLPFVKFSIPVMTDPNLKMGAKMLYLCLQRFAIGKSYCFPSVGRLAKLMGLEARQIRTYLHNLKERGLIEIEHKAGRSSVYHLVEKECSSVYYDDSGQVRDETIKAMRDAGEDYIVEQILEARGLDATERETIEALGDAESDDIPDEYLEEGPAKEAAKTKRKAPVRSFEKVHAKIEEKNDRAEQQKDRQKERHKKLANIPQPKKQDVPKAPPKQGKRALREEWKIAVYERFPDNEGLHIAEWGPPEWKVAGLMLDAYGFDTVVKYIHGALDNWDALAKKYRLKKPIPNIRIMYNMMGIWISEVMSGKMEEDNSVTTREEALQRREYDERYDSDEDCGPTTF